MPPEPPCGARWMALGALHRLLRPAPPTPSTEQRLAVSPARTPLPPLGSIVAIWWDDPSMDPEIYDPADADPLKICPKVTVGVLVGRSRATLVLSHEAYLDGSGRQWVRTVISRRLVDRVETIPGVVIALPKPPRAPKRTKAPLLSS